jgi:hypothetical protein
MRIQEKKYMYQGYIAKGEDANKRSPDLPCPSSVVPVNRRLQGCRLTDRVVRRDENQQRIADEKCR